MTGDQLVVRADHLGPCAAASCGVAVRAGEECSTCLEEDGLAVHDACCWWGGTGPHADAIRSGLVDK